MGGSPERSVLSLRVLKFCCMNARCCLSEGGIICRVWGHLGSEVLQGLGQEFCKACIRGSVGLVSGVR